MDPNQTLVEIEQLTSQLRSSPSPKAFCDTLFALEYTARDLRSWIAKGGFVPTGGK